MIKTRLLLVVSLLMITNNLNAEPLSILNSLFIGPKGEKDHHNIIIIRGMIIKPKTRVESDRVSLYRNDQLIAHSVISPVSTFQFQNSLDNGVYTITYSHEDKRCSINLEVPRITKDEVILDCSHLID